MNRRTFFKGLAAALASAVVLPKLPAMAWPWRVGTLPVEPVAPAVSPWIPCDGRSLSRALYPDLFGVVGTSHGALNGEQFSIPDFFDPVLKGEVPSDPCAFLAVPKIKVAPGGDDIMPVGSLLWFVETNKDPVLLTPFDLDGRPAWEGNR